MIIGAGTCWCVAYWLFYAGRRYRRQTAAWATIVTGTVMLSVLLS